ncbi:unnamed protein product [Larinioides sclopetarius]|uniref:Uncharacterized protein n=1 Tax=Larinioides sclopetarius TaxID=280406 RepID=A0AAV2AHH4_9ARAC
MEMSALFADSSRFLAAAGTAIGVSLGLGTQDSCIFR